MNVRVAQFICFDAILSNMALLQLSAVSVDYYPIDYSMQLIILRSLLVSQSESICLLLNCLFLKTWNRMRFFPNFSLSCRNVRKVRRSQYKLTCLAHAYLSESDSLQFLEINVV